MKKYILATFLILSIGSSVNANTLEPVPTEPTTEPAPEEPVATDEEGILEETEIEDSALTDPVDPTDPSADTQLLQAIEDRLENLEGIQKDQFSLLHDLGYIALGTLIGLVAFHLLFREVLKW